MKLPFFDEIHQSVLSFSSKILAQVRLFFSFSAGTVFSPRTVNFWLGGWVGEGGTKFGICVSKKSRKMGHSEMHFPHRKWKKKDKVQKCEKQTLSKSLWWKLFGARWKRLVKPKPAIFDKKWHFQMTKLDLKKGLPILNKKLVTNFRSRLCFCTELK